MNLKKLSWLRIYEGLCAIIGVIGIFIVADKHPIPGFSISIIASMMFVVYNWITKQYSLMIMSVIYLFADLYGLINWMSHK